MADLWLAVTTGNPRFARPGFFPLAAYEQVKAEPLSPPLTGRTGSGTTSFSMSAPPTACWAPAPPWTGLSCPRPYAAWVYPGACHNTIGYWHVPGARVVYRAHGKERSFGIASLISWRAVWYVVHLGAVKRTVVTGIVDQPAACLGVPGPPGGC